MNTKVERWHVDVKILKIAVIPHAWHRVSAGFCARGLFERQAIFTKAVADFERTTNSSQFGFDVVVM
jgi:hypothetical protein